MHFLKITMHNCHSYQGLALSIRCIGNGDAENFLFETLAIKIEVKYRIRIYEM